MMAFSVNDRMDCRVKPGNDEKEEMRAHISGFRGARTVRVSGFLLTGTKDDGESDSEKPRNFSSGGYLDADINC